MGHRVATSDSALFQGCILFYLNLFIEDAAFLNLDVLADDTWISNQGVIDLRLIFDYNIVPHNTILDDDAFPDRATLSNHGVCYLGILTDLGSWADHTVVSNSALQVSFDQFAVVSIEWLNLLYSSVENR